MSIDYALVLKTKFAGQEWSLNGDDYEGLVWLSDTPKPSKKTLDDLYDVVIVEKQNEANEKLAKKQAILDRLGLSEDEAKLLLS